MADGPPSCTCFPAFYPPLRCSSVAVRLVYGFMTSMACGYAPNSSGCHAWPWALNSDDQFWLVIVPGLLVGTLLVFAWAPWAARNKARKRRD
jgi:hypothetical protein